MMTDVKQVSTCEIFHKRKCESTNVYGGVSKASTTTRRHLSTDSSNDKKNSVGPSSSDGGKSDTDEENNFFFLHSFACSKPHPRKENTLGEDSYYISLTNKSVGVADGVGGWSEWGIDSGAFSRELMHGCKEAADIGMESPIDILRSGFQRVQSQGSSTACIICVRDDTLEVGNLGDSGFILLRKTESKFDSGDRRSPPQLEWTTVAKSIEQLHSFNCPVQLGTSSTDTADSADLIAITVEDGDVAVCCTDGILDNVWEDEISSICSDAFQKYDEAIVQNYDRVEDFKKLRVEATEAFCSMLVKVATDNAESKTRRSPFEANAKRWGYPYRGGKMDDITVVVSLVSAAPSS